MSLALTFVLAFFGLFILAGGCVVHAGLRDGQAEVVAIGGLFLLVGLGMSGFALGKVFVRRRERRPPPGATLAFRLVPCAPPARDPAEQEAAKGGIFAAAGTLFCALMAVATYEGAETGFLVAGWSIVGLVTLAGYAFVLKRHLGRRLHRRGGRVFVEVSRYPVLRGSPVSLRVAIEGPLELRDVVVQFEAQAAAAVARTGSSRGRYSIVTGPAGAHPVHVASALGVPSGGPAVIDAKVTLPPELAASQEHGLRWFVSVSGTIRRAGDWERAFAVEVA